MNRDIAKVGELLNRARRVLFITGAGVSAESQIPTFRGATAAFADGMTEDGMPFEEALGAETFRKNPALSWKYLALLELSIRGKLPNAAHEVMAALQTPRRDIFIATQNIDELHQRAGSRSVFELHGNLRRIICTRCDYGDACGNLRVHGQIAALSPMRCELAPGRGALRRNPAGGRLGRIPTRAGKRF